MTRLRALDDEEDRAMSVVRQIVRQSQSELRSKLQAATRGEVQRLTARIRELGARLRKLDEGSTEFDQLGAQMEDAKAAVFHIQQAMQTAYCGFDE